MNKIIKKMVLYSLVIFALSYILGLSSPVFKVYAQPPPTPTTTDTFATEKESRTLDVYLKNLYIWSIGIAGMLAIIMLMYAGYGYATSMGNPDKINESKEIIVGALAGLALLVLAALILQSLGI